jgi:hypothetical protein
MKLILAFLMFSLPVHAEEYGSEIFEPGSSYSKKLFSYRIKTTDEGALTRVSTRFLDTEANVVVEEKGVLKGSNLVTYEIDDRQTGRKGSVEVKDGTVTFAYLKDGKESRDSEKLGETLVAPVNFARFIKDNWEKLSAGKDVDIRYAVWDRKETVGFSLRKMGEEEIKGKKLVKIRMKPSSFVIAALVQPIYVFLPADGSRLMALNGRVTPKLKSGKNWKDLDAEVLYSYGNSP